MGRLVNHNGGAVAEPRRQVHQGEASTDVAAIF
jgi:hypothetical protein